MAGFTKGDLVDSDDHVYVLAATLWSLWDVTIVGHPAGGPCPYQVGHSLTEHCVIGLGLWDTLDTFNTAIGRKVRVQR